MMNHRFLFSSVAALALVAGAFAEAKTFNVGGPQLAPRQVVTVVSDADFENFTARTSSVSGSITFDPAKRTGGGTIVVDLKTLDTGIPLRNEHMNGGQWLDTDKFPNATFQATEVRHRGGDRYRVSGRFTLKGVTKTITTEATLRYVAASEQSKAAGFQGDVVQLRTSFNIKLADYGIVVSGQAKGKVAETVAINITTWGVSR